jgi:photosystem II stability/assembly factor-like uncharacterized protein
VPGAFPELSGIDAMNSSFSRSPRARPATQNVLGLAALTLAASCLEPPVPTTPTAVAAGVTGGGSGEVASSPYVWKSVVINGGGFVTGLVFSSVKPGILYARTDIGGAYRYEPKDKSWVPLTDFVSRKDSNYLGIESIATDPVNADRVYMAVGMYAQPWAGPGAFMRSDDQGATWRLTPMPSLKMGGNDLGRSNGERLAVDPHQPKILYFGSRLSGMWKSSDEAETWHKLESFPVKDDAKGLGIPFVLFEPSSGKAGEPTRVLYAGVSRTEQNLYRSTDAGASWQLVPKQPSGFLPSRAALDRDGTLYVSYGNDPGPWAVQDGALYRYEPKHDTWTDISPIKPSDTDRFGYGAVTVDPSNPGTLLATTIDRWTVGGEIFRSRDRGKTWKSLMAQAVFDSAGTPYVYHHKEKLGAPQWMGDIKIDPFAPDHAAVIDGGGVWATEDLTKADKDEPTRWVYRTKNLEETAVRGLISPPEGPPLLSIIGDVCGFRHDALDESPQRGTFNNPACASGDSIDFAQKNPKVVARVGTYPWDGSKTPRGAISSDGGITWAQFGSEPAGSSGSGSIAVSADGTTLLWAPKDAAVSRSVDRGVTWVRAQGLPNPTKVPDWAPMHLRVAADRVNAKKFYVYDALSGKVYASEDGAATFSSANRTLTELPEYNLIVGSVQAVPGFEGHVWVTGGKELFRSTDSGRSYSSVSNVEESYAVGFGAPPPGKKYPAVYLSGQIKGVSGFFRSDDEGATFVRINDDQHQYGGSNIIIGDPRVYGRAYIAPGGRGILYGEPR